MLLANLLFRQYGLPLYDQPTAPLRLKVRMLKAEVMETMLYGCVTWSPTIAHLAILRKTHHRLFLRCIGWKRKHDDVYHVLSYADALAKTGCENVDTTVRKQRILFAGFVARMGNVTLSKRVTFGELEGGKGYVGGQEQDWMGCLERDLSLFNLPTETKQWMLAAKNSGKWFRRVEESAEQYMKRWFSQNAAKRRALEVQTAQQLETSSSPRLGGGGERGAALKEA